MAITIDYGERITLGNKYLWKARIRGDGSNTDVTVPLGRIEGYWTQSIDDTVKPAPSISYSGNVLTYASAPSSTKYQWLFVIGVD